MVDKNNFLILFGQEGEIITEFYLTGVSKKSDAISFAWKECSQMEGFTEVLRTQIKAFRVSDVHMNMYPKAQIAFIQ